MKAGIQKGPAFEINENVGIDGDQHLHGAQPPADVSRAILGLFHTSVQFVHRYRAVCLCVSACRQVTHDATLQLQEEMAATTGGRR